MKNKKIVASILGLTSIALITLGVSIALFNYSKQGINANTITSGNLKFTYDEVDGIGQGIVLENATPILDSQGKSQTGRGNVFEFKVSAKSASQVAIPYEITVRAEGDNIGTAVKVYLTKVVGNSEEELVLSKFSSLTPTTRTAGYNERLIYNGTVPLNQANYTETYRLRMWVADDADFSDGSLNDKEFKITVNVYANERSINSNSTFAANEVSYSNTDTVSCTGSNATVECAVLELQNLLSR